MAKSSGIVNKDTINKINAMTWRPGEFVDDLVKFRRLWVTPYVGASKETTRNLFHLKEQCTNESFKPSDNKALSAIIKEFNTQGGNAMKKYTEEFKALHEQLRQLMEAHEQSMANHEYLVTLKNATDQQLLDELSSRCID